LFLYKTFEIFYKIIRFAFQKNPCKKAYKKRRKSYDKQKEGYRSTTYPLKRQPPLPAILSFKNQFIHPVNKAS